MRCVSLRCSTPSSSCDCHPSVALVCAWIWLTQSRAGSTVGHLCSQLQSRSPLYVVHSPFGWFYHRCHCNCRDLVLFVVAMSCGGLDGAYNSIWDSVRPMTGKYITYYFQYHDFVRCVCMLNYLFSSNDEFCPDNYNYSGAGCQYQEDVGCVCMLHGWISCSDDLRRQLQLLPVQVEWQGSQCWW